MKFSVERTRVAWVLGLAVALLSSAQNVVAHSDSSPKLRPWKTIDSVERRHFQYDPAHPTPLANIHEAPDAKRPALLSPDGRHFLYVSLRGDLRNDQVIGELWVHSVEKVLEGMQRNPRSSVEALHRVEFRMSRGDDFGLSPILQPHWRDERRIEFAGMQGDAPRQLYQFDIVSGEVIQLTHARQDIIGGHFITRSRSYETALEGDHPPSILYRTYELVLKESVFDTPLDTYPVAVIPQQTDELDDPLNSFFHPFKTWSPVNRLYAIYRGGLPKLVREEGPKILHEQGRAAHEGSLDVRGQWLSPDGRYAVLAYALGAKNVPDHWAQYENPPRNGIQYVLVDMQAGTMRPILDAPVGTAMSVGAGLPSPFGAYWSDDSESVLLFNTALPLDDDKDVRRSMAYIVNYRVRAGDWQVVAPMQSEGLRIRAAQWSKQGETLLLDRALATASGNGANTGEGPVEADGLLLRHSAGTWQVEPAGASVEVATTASWPEGLRVFVQEDENLPQTMMAERGSQRVALSSPDPALQGVTRIDWEPLQITSGGKVLDARVLRPEGTGAKPLVILMADPRLHRGRFMPDGGPYPAFAAQTLAAQGFVVLHLESASMLQHDEALGPRLDNTIMFTPREGPAAVASVDDAIDALVERGWIDQTRVGLVGFSRSGYHVYYTITHPERHHIKVAVVFDSVDAGYGSYVNGMALGDPVSVYELQYSERDPAATQLPSSAQTFWQNKQAWLDAPAFNLDRASTPTLFSITGRMNAWGMMETLGAWRYTKLPFEYHLYPKAQHVPLLPLELARSFESTVDWMRFWLQGVAPADAAQAERWSKMKANWEQVRADRSSAAGAIE